MIVLIQNDLFRIVLERIQEPEIRARRPKPVEQVAFVARRLFSLFKCVERVDIQHNTALWTQKSAEHRQHRRPLRRTQRTEVVHDQSHEIEVAVR